jgi:diaminohydroxyphosphoribosylaminopyrimidine deaminase/5-amino-6-(5-phosphoribosylamino)uracil reductase
MPDQDIMLQAVALAEKARGLTAPNPCVGALIVQDGQIRASGFHRQAGGPHAEVAAMNQAGERGIDLRHSELWVTLEPCNHHGRTPPCTQAILQAGIPRVVVGIRDPNPGVQGGGIETLRSKGVQVEVGVAEQACRDLIADFLCWQEEARPYVQLKLACSLDGRIGTRTGHSVWVTGEEARLRVHRLRSRVQAVMVGGATLMEDNPSLTCRLQDRHQIQQPLAVVVTSRLPEPDARLNLLNRPRDLILLTPSRTAQSREAQRLQDMGVRIWALPGEEGRLEIAPGLKRLFAEQGCFTLLCEGGGRLAMSLARQGLVDELHCVFAPRVLGDEQARSSFAGQSVNRMEQTLSWRFVSHDTVGDDLWTVLRPRRGHEAR